LTGWFLSDLVLKIHMAPEIIRIIETNVLPAEWYRHNFREKNTQTYVLRGNLCHVW
jgi:hypothetical protein